MLSVGEIAERINARARELAQELLPNGSYSQGKDKWMFSGIADTGRSASAWVHLSGPKIGKWFDMGNALAGEEKGDMLDLLRLKLCLAEPRDAIEEAKRRLGIVDDWKPGKPALLSPEERDRRAREAQDRAAIRDAEFEKERQAKVAGAKSLYLKGKPMAGTGAEFYLINRGVCTALEADAEGAWPNSLKFHPEVYCKELSVKVPTMLGTIVNAMGEQVGVHRTFLHECPRRGWVKAEVVKPKKVLGPCKGGFIPINRGSSGKSMRHMPEGEAIYVTEGVEDALVVRMMRPVLRIIAAYSLGNIGEVLLPPAAKRLVIVADNDPNLDEQDKLERSIAKQQARGIEVLTVRPPAEHKDINDWWIALRRQQGRAA
ncbi:toprim domain-containing protein [Novosphingobium sp. BL-52-GroH]|uniref:DUF7146 domain-containing protein n=1 Tax=Novosphingobium sp. BL-52-GroH TaxID=3349877 RepID=UPI00384F272D